jgi:hypothetical protein
LRDIKIPFCREAASPVERILRIHEHVKLVLGSTLFHIHVVCVGVLKAPGWYSKVSTIALTAIPSLASTTTVTVGDQTSLDVGVNRIHVDFRIAASSPAVSNSGAACEFWLSHFWMVPRFDVPP